MLGIIRKENVVKKDKISKCREDSSKRNSNSSRYRSKESGNGYRIVLFNVVGNLRVVE